MIDFLKSKRKQTPSGVGLDFVSFKQYVSSGDYRRNAIDLIPGWNHSLPPDPGAEGGGERFWCDDRVAWAIEQHGGVSGAHVLEIGPMEATHTCQLERAGARVDAVEANRLAFLKCLVAKEILDLKAKFFLAEVNDWMRQSTQLYDLVVACGVLYHMRDPLALLELCARKAPALFLWTHYVADSERERAAQAQSPYYSTDRRLGFDVRLFERSYLGAEQADKFCGGVFDNPRWMFRDDLPEALAALGYDDIRIGHEDLTHRNGPAFCIYARRSG